MVEPLLNAPPAGLAPSRIGRGAIDAARAALALNRPYDAERHLKTAFNVAPR
ncbi:hypothetical protein GCM10010245_88200 [Streptomyces spectabilis]|nr:hypothetical protein GCM10010245_88200 [Streptomyces spectabilis]